MIKQLIERASKKAGSQNKLAKEMGITSGRMSEFKNYKIGDKRKPPDELIIKIADYVGMDVGMVLYEAKKELEPENVKLWGFLLGQKDWCARQESNLRPSVSETYQTQLLAA